MNMAYLLDMTVGVLSATWKKTLNVASALCTEH
jgi:hypothetical protein